MQGNLHFVEKWLPVVKTNTEFGLLAASEKILFMEKKRDIQYN